jgi:hypothetical protein
MFSYLNRNKNVANFVLAIIFGTCAGIKENSFIWGVFITVLGALIFTGMDKIRMRV